MRKSGPSLVVAETKDGAAVRGGSETGRRINRDGDDRAPIKLGFHNLR
jgi:hypothetical protein